MGDSNAQILFFKLNSDLKVLDLSGNGLTDEVII